MHPKKQENKLVLANEREARFNWKASKQESNIYVSPLLPCLLPSLKEKHTKRTHRENTRRTHRESTERNRRENTERTHKQNTQTEHTERTRRKHHENTQLELWCLLGSGGVFLFLLTERLRRENGNPEGPLGTLVFIRRIAMNRNNGDPGGALGTPVFI